MPEQIQIKGVEASIILDSPDVSEERKDLVRKLILLREDRGRVVSVVFGLQEPRETDQIYTRVNLRKSFRNIEEFGKYLLQYSIPTPTRGEGCLAQHGEGYALLKSGVFAEFKVF